MKKFINTREGYIIMYIAIVLVPIACFIMGSKLSESPKEEEHKEVVYYVFDADYARIETAEGTVEFEGVHYEVPATVA